MDYDPIRGPLGHVPNAMSAEIEEAGTRRDSRWVSRILRRLFRSPTNPVMPVLEASNHVEGSTETMHEHPETFFPASMVDPHRFYTIRTALAAATSTGPAGESAYEDIITDLETRVQTIDLFISRGRAMIFGDKDSLEDFRAWLLDEDTDFLARTGNIPNCRSRL